MNKLQKKELIKMKRYILKNGGDPVARGTDFNDVITIAQALGYDSAPAPINEAPRTHDDLSSKLDDLSEQKTISERLQEKRDQIERDQIERDQIARDDTLEPIFKPAQAPNDDKAHQLAALIASLTDTPTIDPEQIKALIKTQVDEKFESAQIARPIEITINDKKTNTKTVKTPELAHIQFEDILKCIQTKCNTYIVGGAGSGKTFAVEQAAKALGIPFYYSGAVSSGFKLTGFIDGAGNYQKTPFYDAWTNGGLFCLDEIDAGSAEALLTINGMLAGELGDFPCGMTKRHPDFFCVATANTIGQGADRVYCGRSQIDGASLDRFIFIDFKYDEALESALTDNQTWFKRVVAYRRAANKLKLRELITPRATLHGAKLIAVGFDNEAVEKMVIFKGMDAHTIDKLKREVR